MPPARTPLQNILWLVGERFGRAAFTATVLALVARHLGPAGFGRLNFAIALTTIATALGNLGLEGIVVDELVRRPGQSGAVLGTAVRLRLLAGFGTAVLLTGLCLLAPSLRSEAGLIGVVSLGLLIQPVEVIDLWFQRHLDSRRTVIARTAGIVAGGLVKLCLVARHAPLAAFAWAQVADCTLIGAALLWAGWHSPHARGPLAWDVAMARQLCRRGAPLALSALVVALALRFDQLLVSRWLGGDAAGRYFAATRLTDLVLFGGTAMAVSLFPALSASVVRSAEEYQARLQAMFDAFSAIGWLWAAGCTLGGSLVIRLLFGPEYVAATNVLAVQGWAAIFALSGTVRWNYILLSAPVTLNLAAAALHLVVLLPLALWLVPRQGATGAALAWLVAAGVSGVGTSLLFPPLHPCAKAQLRSLLIPFTPARWPALLAQFQG